MRIGRRRAAKPGAGRAGRAHPPLGAPAWTEPPPDSPELPDAADPRWPAWFAPLALIGGFIAAGFALVPVFVPLGLTDQSSLDSGGLEGATLLLLIAVQDAVLVGAALLFARLKLRPRLWHFGLRRVRFWPAAGFAALAAVVVLGFEVGYIALLGGGEGGVDDLGAGRGLGAAIAVAVAVIVVAPVTEEFFFRAFFYRALRNRMRIGWAALIDALVFASLHFEGINTLATLPVIAVFGVGVCLLYERTGSLFPAIAVHATFNTFATVGGGAQVTIVALVTGALVLLGCVLVPRRLSAAPSPLRGAARKRRRLAPPPAALMPDLPPPAPPPPAIPPAAAAAAAGT